MAENVSIKDQLQKLVQLQQLDTKIFDLEKQKKEIPEESAKLEQLFLSKKQHAEDIKKEIDTLLLKRKEKELGLATKEEASKKFQNQLYSLKSNKEYTAMLKEIEGIRADKSVIEDELLQIFDLVDTKKDEFNKEQERLKLEEQKLSKDKEAVNIRLKEIDQELATLANKRKQIIDLVDSKILAAYEKILQNRAGIAIASVKNETCQGCFMNVTPQDINEIKMYDRIIFCQMCARILYLEEELGV
jgi:predicted  nucleic acid-binding Zn-ribbon protein